MTIISWIIALADRRRGIVLAAVGLFAVASAVLAFRASFATDVLSLLPRNSAPLRVFGQYLEHFGAVEDLFIVFDVPAGEQVSSAGPLVDAFVGRVRALPDIEKVDAGASDAGKDWTYLQDHELLLLGPARAADALATFDPPRVRQALARSRDLLSTSGPSARALVQSDPLGLLGFVRDHFAGDRAFSFLQPGQPGYVSADGRSRLVIATPRQPPFDSAFNRRLFAELDGAERNARATVASSDGSPLPRVQISYTGGHRIATETETAIRREATWNGVTSMLAILVFLLVMFRSPWLFLVAALPMAVATLGSVALTSAIHGRLSAAATGTSALLFGLGIDGLVLLYLRYLEEREHGATAREAIARLSGPGTSMLLGCWTTAATFLGLTLADLPGLQELGLLVGIGMLLGGPLTLVLVVALLPRTVSRPRSPSASWLAPFIRQHRIAILAASAILTAGSFAFIPRLHLDLSLQRLQPNSPAVALQRDLGRRFGVDRDVALVIGQHAELETLLAADRRLVSALSHAAVPVSMSGPSALLPPLEEQRGTGDLLRPVHAQLATIQTDVRAAANRIGFRPEAIEPFLTRMPALLDPDARLTYQGYVAHGFGDLLKRYVVTTPEGFMTAAYVDVRNAADSAELARAVAAAGPELTLTGVPIVNAELASRFAPGFAVGLAVGSGLVFLLMFLTFKRVSLTILALVPTVLGLIWSAGLLAAFGVQLDLFSIFAILTLIGIGVDYGIHLVHRFATEGATLDESVARVAPANLVAAGIAVLGCGSLVTSDYPPLHALGVVTVVSLCTCLVTAVFVLPAVLMTAASGTRN